MVNPYAIRLAAFLAILLAAEPSWAKARFGARCQSQFQGDWQKPLTYAYERCSWFVDELDDTDTRVFYQDLKSARNRFSSCDHCSAGVDTVRLLYVHTHGGVKGVDARLAMQENDSLARSSSDGWRFGDEATRVAFFAQYACKTLSDGDDEMWSRWRKAFRGGLLLALGSHDKLWDGVTTNETGEDFADDLQDGKTVKWAWFDGNGDWWSDQDVKIVATGSDESPFSKFECVLRRDALTWQNFTSAVFPRWRDDDVDRWCSSKIDNN
jgi:hypothetical protein